MVARWTIHYPVYGTHGLKSFVTSRVQFIPKYIFISRVLSGSLSELFLGRCWAGCHDQVLSVKFSSFLSFISNFIFYLLLYFIDQSILFNFMCTTLRNRWFMNNFIRRFKNKLYYYYFKCIKYHQAAQWTTILIRLILPLHWGINRPIE